MARQKKNTPPKIIGLFGKYGDAGIVPVISQLDEFLKSRGLQVLLEAETARYLSQAPGATRPLAEIGREIDLAIVIGGDGTMLNVARNLAADRVPLIGVNLGRLGFLTDIPRAQILEELAKILDGDYREEERLQLYGEVERDGKVVFSATALNDVVINKGQTPRLIEFESYINGKFVHSMRSDGLIIATPTGSTAYAVSAGGPILHPQLAAIVLVPICPHTLSNRPIVVNSDSQVEIVMSYTSNQSAHVAFDGQNNCPLQDNDRIRLRRGDTSVKLIHPANRSHYEVLRTKLRWGEKF